MNNISDHIQKDFQRVFQASPNLYLLLTPGLVIVDASDAYLQATLTTRSEITGRGLFDIFPDNPDDPAADGASNLFASLSSVLQKKEAHAMAIQKYDIRKPDGVFEERFWSPLNSPVLDENNEVQYIIHRVEDVTEMERAKKELAEQQKIKEGLEAKEQINVRHLKESEERFYKIFDLSPISLFMTEVVNGRLVYVNKAFERLFLVKSEVAIGKTVLELGITDESSRIDYLRKIAENKGRGVELELDLRISTGEIKKMLSTVEAIEIDNKKCFLVALLDITERKKMEDSVLRLNKELEAFTYSVSHDLRAPLRAVNGYSRILEEDYVDVLDDEGKRLLGKIGANAAKMGTLIDDLLAFSRLGRKELQKTDVDMDALVAEVIKDIKKGTQNHAIIEVGKLCAIRSDNSLIKQVIVNLLGNAVKYSSKKECPLIKITSTRNGHEIIFSIQDNGVGFDMRYAHKLFGVFQRLHSSEEFEGTGVGLAIVERIILKHDGRVWAESKVNEGATFYFSIPAN